MTGQNIGDSGQGAWREDNSLHHPLGDSHRTHIGLASNSHRTHIGLSSGAHRTRSGLTPNSHRTRIGLAPDPHRTRTPHDASSELAQLWGRALPLPRAPPPRPLPRHIPQTSPEHCSRGPKSALLTTTCQPRSYLSSCSAEPPPPRNLQNPIPTVGQPRKPRGAICFVLRNGTHRTHDYGMEAREGR